MTWRKGPRPWPINGFAAIFITVGAWQLANNLSKLHRIRIEGPDGPLSQDWVIVFLSAQFTILCIPVAAIWLYGSGVARWLITIMTAWGALNFLMQLDKADLSLAMQMSLLDIWNLYGTRMAFVVAVMFLFVPAARGWFGKPQEVDLAVFE